MARQVDGLALGMLGFGGLFVYAGIKGYSVPHALQALITGKPPSTGGVAYPITTPTGGPGSPGAGTPGTAGIAPTNLGEAIANDFLGYVGKVPYVWGGASPVTGWDCSGSCNYVINKDNDTAIPEFGPGQLTGHGPATETWLAWAPGHMTHLTESTAGIGDLVIWQTHMGVITGRQADGLHYVSAYDTQKGTVDMPVHGGGPWGEIATFWRLR